MDQVIEQDLSVVAYPRDPVTTDLVRCGHKSGGLEQCFDAHATKLVVMISIEQDQLIQQHGAESSELAATQAFDAHLPALLKEVFEQAIERFNRLGVQFVKEMPDFNSAISVRIGAAVCGGQFAVVTTTRGAQIWGIGILIAQDIADLGGQLGKQQRCDLAISDINNGKLSSQGHPQIANRHHQVQLPAIPPPLPARLALMGFGINGGVGDDARFSIFLMPDTTVRANHRNVTVCFMSLLSLRIEEPHPVASEPPNKTWQGRREHR